MNTIGTKLAIALALAAPTVAQECALPDGLDGPCCAQVNPNLPQLPALTLPGSAICYDACVPGEKQCARMELGLPVASTCTEFSVLLKVNDCDDDAEILSGSLQLDYTRTWMETQMGPGGGALNRQVWRFLAKGDLSGDPDLFDDCLVPSCLQTFDEAFYYGYVDYTRDCDSGQFASAAVLFHACDHFVHDAALSDHPGVFHPDRSFALVMPDTAANPFLPGIVQAPGGTLFEEAVRTVRSLSGAPLCLAEEDLLQGQLVPLGSACFCPLDFNWPQVTASFLNGTGTCLDAAGNPSSFQSQNFFGLTPWIELMSHSIGSWTTMAAYPGQERVWVSEGLFKYHDSCAAQPGVAPGNSIDIHYGAITRGGFAPQAIGDGDNLTDVFVDLASNFSHATGLGIPIQPPVLGSVQPTNHLIYVNAVD